MLGHHIKAGGALEIGLLDQVVALDALAESVTAFTGLLSRGNKIYSKGSTATTVLVKQGCLY